MSRMFSEKKPKRGWLPLSWFLNVGKIQDPDSNDSLKPGKYDAKRILVRRCEKSGYQLRFYTFFQI